MHTPRYTFVSLFSILLLLLLTSLSACGDSDDPAATSGKNRTAEPDTGWTDFSEDLETNQDPDTPPQDAGHDLLEEADLPEDLPDVEEDQDTWDPKDPDTWDEDEDEPPPVSSHINIDVLGALIGPGKSDRTQWDGFGHVPDEIWLTVAIWAQLPIHDALDFLSTTTVQSLSKPDPVGTTEIDLGDGWEQPYNLGPRTNTFQPLFDNATYTNIPSEAELRLKVELWDEDVALDDPIGAVILSRDHVMEALEEGGSLWVNVANQSNGQLVYVQIAVAEFTDNE